MAAGLRDPALVRRWREDPEALARLGVAPDELDLEALARFAGLTVKVRHNPTRDSLPATFRMLQVTGLEVELFGAYALARAEGGKPFASGTQDRARELVEFLEGWVDTARPEQCMLGALARHELTIAELAALSLPDEPPAQRPTQVHAEAIPRVRGVVRLLTLEWDPRAITAAVQTASPALDGLTRGLHRLCYWRAGPSLRLVELDLAGYRAMELVHGRTAGEIAGALTGRAGSPEGLALLGQLASAGLITLA